MKNNICQNNLYFLPPASLYQSGGKTSTKKLKRSLAFFDMA
jgi:hypothetical protein